MSTEQAYSKRNESVFLRWMRTGRWLLEQVADPALEVKFNPYHDPDNGQFTFAPGGAGSAGMTRPPKRPQRKEDGGSWGSRFKGGGGGTGGGGGATGTYPWPKPTPKPTMPAQNISATRTTNSVSPARVVQQPSIERSTTINKNGYAFKLDASRRPVKVIGELSIVVTAPRSKLNQRQAGGTDRRHTDDGGNFIAARFNGPSDKFNHFAQDASFNRGGYRALEDQWAKNLRAGKRVSVDLAANYKGALRRPSSLSVEWTVDGHLESQVFFNEPKGKRLGR